MTLINSSRAFQHLASDTAADNVCRDSPIEQRLHLRDVPDHFRGCACARSKTNLQLLSIYLSISIPIYIYIYRIDEHRQRIPTVTTVSGKRLFRIAERKSHESVKAYRTCGQSPGLYLSRRDAEEIRRRVVSSAETSVWMDVYRRPCYGQQPYPWPYTEMRHGRCKFTG